MNNLQTYSGQQMNLTNQIIEASKGSNLIYETDIHKKIVILIWKICDLLNVPNDKRPNDDAMINFVNFAREKWYNLTLNDIFLAVKCNINHEFDEKIENYGSISISYIADCIFHYRKLKGKILIKERQRQEALNRPQTHLSDEENNELLYDGMVKFVNEQHRLPEFWNFTAVFYHMQDTGKLDHWNNLRKADLRSQVEAEMNANRQRNRKLAISLDERRANTGEVPEEDIREECRKRVVLAELAKLLEIKNPDYLSGEESAT